MDTLRFDEGSSSLSVRTSFECFQLCLHPAIEIIISWYSSPMSNVGANLTLTLLFRPSCCVPFAILAV